LERAIWERSLGILKHTLMNIIDSFGQLAKKARSGKTTLAVSALIIIFAISLLAAFPLLAIIALNLMGAGIAITWKSWLGAFLLWSFLKITLNASRSKD
jgi:uncharacterized membrane protein (DUF485 family)